MNTFIGNGNEKVCHIKRHVLTFEIPKVSIQLTTRSLLPLPWLLTGLKEASLIVLSSCTLKWEKLKTPTRSDFLPVKGEDPHIWTMQKLLILTLNPSPNLTSIGIKLAGCHERHWHQSRGKCAVGLGSAINTNNPETECRENGQSAAIGARLWFSSHWASTFDCVVSCVLAKNPTVHSFETLAALAGVLKPLWKPTLEKAVTGGEAQCDEF